MVLDLNLADEAEALALFVEDPSGASPGCSRNLVGNHRLNGLPPQHPDAVKLPIISDHEQEAQVILERGDHAALDRQRHLDRASSGEDVRTIVAHPTAFGSRLVNNIEIVSSSGRHFFVLLPFVVQRGLTLIPRGHAGRLLRGHAETCVDHTERLADLLIHRAIQREARNHLKHSAQDIGCERILPIAAWADFQWYLGELVDPLG
mmetsp:Transcript_49962/g.139974  ORF Transcript_49962/g.139974 Transcript_49962/m.139974 type:complete len:205 (+) Transcript_49962:1176-1790(+)